MRKEPYIIGSYVHVYNRGNRKAEIVRSEKDYWRFMQALRFFNDSYSSVNLLRQLSRRNPNFDEVSSVFELGWPPDWPSKNPLVRILCYCLVPNHFHLLLKEVREGGISRFMQKIGVGYTNYFNTKYQEVGRVFQGPYKAKIVDEERYLEYLSVYIQVINVLELFPMGLEKALANINDALKFVEEYPFSSYRDFVGLRKSLIINKDILSEIFPAPEKYRRFIYNTIAGRGYESLGDLKME